jgi:hypothetical protein
MGEASLDGGIRREISIVVPERKAGKSGEIGGRRPGSG